MQIGTQGGGERGWAMQAALHAAVLLFGVAGLFGKWITLHAWQIVLGRVAVASLVFVLLRRLPVFQGPRPDARARWLLVATGVLLAFHWSFFFHAIQASTVAIGLLGYATAPAFTALLEPLVFRTRVPMRALGSAVLSIAGVAWMVPEWSIKDEVMYGAFWGVMAGATFALLTLLARGLVRRYSPVDIAMYQDITATMLVLPLVFALDLWETPTWGEVGLIVVLGVVCTAVAHSLYILALRRVAAWQAAVTSALEPVYGIVLALLLLGEQPAPRTLAGGALILGAVVWAGWPMKK